MSFHTHYSKSEKALVCRQKWAYIVLLFIFSLGACETNVSGGAQDNTGKNDAALAPPKAETRIDASTEEICTKDCLEIESTSTSLTKFGGTYPRASVLNDQSIFLSFDSTGSGDYILRTSQSKDNGESWTAAGSIARHKIEKDRTLGNAFPLQLPSGRILSAYRHHDRPDKTKTDIIYRLLVSYSDDTGSTWNFLSEIDVNIGNGVWEPFLFNAPDGLQVYYAREKKLGGDQDIVMRRSADNGKTWSNSILVASKVGSRDGMPAVTTLKDNSLLVVFESFRSTNSGTFVLRTVQSKDKGATWPLRKDLYLPSKENRNAGAPHVITLSDGRLLASFMTDEDATVTSWPEHAGVKVIATIGTPSFESIQWGTPLAIIPEPVFWPSLVQTPNGSVLVLYDQQGPKMRKLKVR